MANIVSLVLKKGAGLLPPRNDSIFNVERDGPTIHRSMDIELKIEQSFANPETTSTINIILDFLKVSSKSPLRDDYEPELRLS